MSQYHVGGTCDITFVAEADLRSYQYHIVKVTSTANQVTVASSATGTIGVLQNAPNINEQALVRISGPSKCILDGTTDIAAGDGILSDSSGHGIQNTSTDKARIVGWALEPYTDSTPLPKEILVAVQTQSI